ncbi:MAG: stage II sporulation protein E [Bacillota bacterium]|nr:stage II sporulation protein E [Bacillota bacterium]
MMKTEIEPYHRNLGVADLKLNVGEKGLLKSIFSKNNIILLVLGFLLGRASLFGGMMPFGLPLYAAVNGLGVNRMLLAVAIIFGMFTGGAGEQIYITIAAMLLFNAFNIPFRNNKTNINVRYSIIAFGSVLVPALLTTYLQGFLLYDVLKNFLQGFVAFALVFIFLNAVPSIFGNKRKYSYTNEEIVSIAILASLALAGFNNIILLGFNIKNIMAVVCVLLISYNCGSGAGTAVGVTMGLMVSMSSSVTPFVIASYAFCGLLSGVFRNLGKIGSVVGFILGNTIITLYLNGSIEVLIYLKEIIVGVIIFFIIPEKVIEMLTGNFRRGSGAAEGNKTYTSQIREITIERLNKFAHAFKELSKTFGEISETKVVTDKQDISSLFDRVADKVCKNCSLCMYCWDRNFYNTYQVMFKIVEKLDSKGRIEQSDIPDYFLERCERICEFAEEVNNIYEIFRIDMVWKSKIGESRNLISQQLEGLSKVIYNLASEINTEIHFRSDIEDVILGELNGAGIKASQVIVLENKFGKYEITIFHKGCGGKRVCVSNIEKVVTGIVGRKMVKEIGECSYSSRNDICTLRLVEEEIFRVTTGVSKMSMYDDAVSGDSYTFMNTGDGRYILALSDGMGSGQRASVQSKATVNLLEQFMESGFDKDTTIKLINSILVLKSSDDSFSTIDMSIIDLYKGDVEFVKIGAVPTYIKREGSDVVETVKSASLPVGILSNIEVELVHKKVNSGDFVIMVTDGVIDSLRNCKTEEKDLVSVIKSITSTNPQEIADRILDEAYGSSGGRPVDDMMVVVAKVWKRI